MTVEFDPPSLLATARLFLRLGTTAFGGPAAHIAIMEDEIVRRRRWMSREQFLDYLGATNLIPGPNSTELAIHVGMARHGWPGLLVAGLCFILPSAIIVGLIAWAYVRYGSLPDVAGILRGITPVVIAIVASALWHLGRTAVKSAALAMLGVGAFVALLAGVHELVVLLATGRGERCFRRCAPVATHVGPDGAGRRVHIGVVAGLGDRQPLLRAGLLRSGGPVLVVVAVSGLRQDRRAALRQRLCAARVPACRGRRASRLAH